MKPLANKGRLTVAAIVATLAFAGFHALGADPADNDRPVARHLSTYVWRMDDPEFGGFSGIDISADGSRFTALSDRATLRWGRIIRDADGNIESLETEGRTRLKDMRGRPLPPGRIGDSEGIAVAGDGTIHISFEGLTRVARYATPGSPAEVLESPPAFKRMQKNSSLEALAIMPDGTLLTVPERSGSIDRPFPVWRWRNGTWDQPYDIPRNGNWLPVGADIGPDGRLYLLERDFKGLLGFLSRVRRFEVTETALLNETVLMRSRAMRFDNLEGIAAWDDGQGIRLTMISDDNFQFLQRTEIVEFRAPY